MPRRKKLPETPDFTGLGNGNKNPTDWVVQKSNPLKTLSNTSMTLPEFKILDAYLSRIDSHKPDERYIRFEKGELEHLLGVTRISKSDLETRLHNLFQTVKIEDNEKQNGFTLISLFERAEATCDKNGLWQIDLACSPAAMKYIFNIENIGYLHYRLKNVVNLTSRYSYILFLYLEANHYRKSWEEDLLLLKQALNCNAERYNEFKFFNSEILKKCHSELTEKTDMRYSYKPVKKGRKVIAVSFTIETISDSLPPVDNVNQITFDDLMNDEERIITSYGDENLAVLAEGCRYEFNKEQMEQIQLILTRIDVPKDRNLSGYSAVVYGRQHYLREKYAALNAEVTRKQCKGDKPIKDRFKYFISMLERDTFEPASFK